MWKVINVRRVLETSGWVQNVCSRYVYVRNRYEATYIMTRYALCLLFELWAKNKGIWETKTIFASCDRNRDLNRYGSLRSPTMMWQLLLLCISFCVYNSLTLKGSRDMNSSRALNRYQTTRFLITKPFPLGSSQTDPQFDWSNITSNSLNQTILMHNQNPYSLWRRVMTNYHCRFPATYKLLLKSSAI